MGCMYSGEPLRICWAMILLAFSDGWKGSQKAKRSLFGQRFDNAVHSPIPLYGPCPQHATFDVTNPALEHKYQTKTELNYTTLKIHLTKFMKLKEWILHKLQQQILSLLAKQSAFEFTDCETKYKIQTFFEKYSVVLKLWFILTTNII